MWESLCKHVLTDGKFLMDSSNPFHSPLHISSYQNCHFFFNQDSLFPVYPNLCLSLSVCSHTKLREVRIGNEVRESEGWRVWFIQVLNPNLRTSIGREAYNFPHFLEHSRQRRERDLSGNGTLMSKINIYYISLECLTIR